MDNNTQHPTEPILEAILQNQDENAKSQEKVLEAILQTIDSTDPEPLLGAQLVQSKKNADNIVNAVKEAKVTITIDGADTATYQGGKGDKGEKGDKGDKGDRGDKGEVGEKGLDGKDGFDGLRGTDGLDGKDGVDGKDGIDGKDGKNGAKGDKGDKGEPGKDGKSISQDIVKQFEKKIKDTESNLLWVNNGAVKSIVAGTNVTVTGDPLNPIISSTGGGTVGPGTANEIAYFDTTTTVNSLTTATYPSLTELSYVKGVTSAIQTQLNAKQTTLVSATNIKTVNGSSLLGSGDLVVSGAGDMVLASAQTNTGAKTFNANTLLDKGSMVFNVKAYGAVGDDSTDDTTAIANAITAATAAGGGIVFFPAGTYKITNTITLAVQVSLLGTGKKSSFIHQVTASLDAFKLVSTSEVDAEFSIRELGLIGAGATNGGSIGTVTISNATPAVISRTAHGMSIGDIVYFTTNGGLPTGITANTPYYIVTAGFGANSFRISLTAEGTTINTSSAGTGTHTVFKRGRGIYIQGVPLDYISMYDLNIESFPGDGLFVGGAIVGTFSNVTAVTNGNHGLVFEGSLSWSTSLTLNSCFGNTNTKVGIYINKATYFALNACAADSNQDGYYIKDCKSINFNGTGAELNTRYNYKVDSGVVYGTGGITFNSPFSTGAGTYGYYITGISTGVIMLAPVDESSPTTSLKIDADAEVTLTNQQFGGAISNTGLLSNIGKQRRIITQSATPAINTNITGRASITGLAQAITSFTTNLTGTPVGGDTLIISITDDGTARAIAWGTSFESSGNVTLPTTTVLSVRLDIAFVWNTVTSKWRCVGIA